MTVDEIKEIIENEFNSIKDGNSIYKNRNFSRYELYSGNAQQYVRISLKEYDGCRIKIKPTSTGKVSFTYIIIANQEQKVEIDRRTTFWENASGQREYTISCGTHTCHNDDELLSKIVQFADVVTPEFDKIKDLVNNTVSRSKSVDLEPRQVIYFGAPGTGKSYQLKEDSGEAGEKFAG